jgi:hypothetical protein
MSLTVKDIGSVIFVPGGAAPSHGNGWQAETAHLAELPDAYGSGHEGHSAGMMARLLIGVSTPWTSPS